jgi:hypothetical protein
MDEEELRAQRQERANRKAARLRLWADSAERKADKERDKHSGYTEDYAFITQPILIGHHSQRRHENLRARISRQMEKEMEFRQLAQSYRERADRLEQGVRVAGDAEARREQKRAENDKSVQIGTKVRDAVFGDAEVVRVNKKTYTLRFASGWQCARDKSYIKI